MLGFLPTTIAISELQSTLLSKINLLKFWDWNYGWNENQHTQGAPRTEIENHCARVHQTPIPRLVWNNSLWSHKSQLASPCIHTHISQRHRDYITLPLTGPLSGNLFKLFQEDNAQFISLYRANMQRWLFTEAMQIKDNTQRRNSRTQRPPSPTPLPPWAQTLGSRHRPALHTSSPGSNTYFK